MVVSPVFRWNSEGLGWGGDLVTARLAGVVAGRSLSPGVPPPPQTTVPTSGSGARCSGTSKTAPCLCRSGSSTRRSGAGSG